MPRYSRARLTSGRTVQSGNWNKDSLTSVINTHISNVVGHYKGKCYAWDVVNGTFLSHPYGRSIDGWKDDPVTHPTDLGNRSPPNAEALNEDGSYRSNPFLRVLGDSYFAIAFDAAAKADPNTKLYYNGKYLPSDADSVRAPRLASS